jgi:hypothetical protein
MTGVLLWPPGDLHTLRHPRTFITILAVLLLLLATWPYGRRHVLCPRSASFIVTTLTQCNISLVDFVGLHPNARALLAVHLAFDAISIACKVPMSSVRP